MMDFENFKRVNTDGVMWTVSSCPCQRMCARWHQSRWEKSRSHPGDVQVEHNRNSRVFFFLNRYTSLPACSTTSSSVHSMLAEWAVFVSFLAMFKCFSVFKIAKERAALWRTWVLNLLSRKQTWVVLTWGSAPAAVLSVQKKPDSQNQDGAQRGQRHKGAQKWTEDDPCSLLHHWGRPRRQHIRTEDRPCSLLHHEGRPWRQHTC